MTYPAAETYIPWQGPAVYQNNRPQAVVIHVGQGWMRTWDAWAAGDYKFAAFHFGVGLKGNVHQYLMAHLGGAHAGGFFALGRPELLPYPNLKTIGVEHEGFSSGLDPQGAPVGQWNDAQIEASAALVSWLCDTCNIPKDREHIIGHYEIDSVNRANDPGPLFPWDRYIDMVKGDDMSAEDKARLARLERFFSYSIPEAEREARLKDLDENVNYDVTLDVGNLNAIVARHLNIPHGGGAALTDHKHVSGGVQP